MEQKDLKDLIKTFDKSSISKLVLKDKDFYIKLEKKAAAIQESYEAQTPPIKIEASKPKQIEAKPQEEKPQSANITTINSPMVGTFYRAPSPDAAPFVNVGDTVKKGQTIAIIEAMKIMNELEAEFDCKILEILVENGQPVEYDMPLFKVEKL